VPDDEAVADANELEMVAVYDGSVGRVKTPADAHWSLGFEPSGTVTNANARSNTAVEVAEAALNEATRT